MIRTLIAGIILYGLRFLWEHFFDPTRARQLRRRQVMSYAHRSLLLSHGAGPGGVDPGDVDTLRAHGVIKPPALAERVYLALQGRLAPARTLWRGMRGTLRRLIRGAA